jgi:hypothetical protein
MVGERGQDADSSELFVNQGNGTFKATADYGARGNSAENMVFADFDRDGKLDLASQANSGESAGASEDTAGLLGVDFGAAGGLFAPELVTAPTPRDNGCFVARDFNGDGYPDLAFAGYDYEMTGGTITDGGGISLPGLSPADFVLSTFLNDGSGGFSPPTSQANGDWLQFGDLRAGDFDGDGHPDLAQLSTREPSGVGVFINAGDGTFGEEARYIASESWIPYGLAVADFNEDGKDDVATTTTVNANLPDEANLLEIFLGNDDHTLHGPVSDPISETPDVYQIATGDFNGDGHVDLAMVMRSTWGSTDPIPVAVFLNAGDGTFGAPVTYGVGGQAFQLVTAIAAGDFNGDGVSDIAVTTTGQEATPNPESLTVLLSQCE